MKARVCFFAIAGVIAIVGLCNVYPGAHSAFSVDSFMHGLWWAFFAAGFCWPVKA